MTSPRFKSTAAFAQRSRRDLPQTDRASFVIFTLRGQLFALAVECTERVLRAAGAGDQSATTVAHGGRDVPVFELAGAFGFVTSGPPDATATRQPRASDDARWLIVSVDEQWIACLVDAVREVATIDVATVRAVAHDDPRQPHGAGVRGAFTRRDQEVLVLDLSRITRAANDATRQRDV